MTHRDPSLLSLPYCGLPPEIWLLIASHLHPTPPIFFTFTTPRPTVAALLRQPALLRTSSLFRSNCLAAFYANLTVMIIGDTELPRSLEGRTGAMPPNLQGWLTAIGLEHREQLGKGGEGEGGVYMSHFREVPVRGGWIDGSIIHYEGLGRGVGWGEVFGKWAQEVEEGGFVFRPWTVRVRFETRRIVLRDSRQRAEEEGRKVDSDGVKAEEGGMARTR